jgi:hypothetical protein
MMELLGSVLTGVLGGGATGLLGVLLQRWFDHKKQISDMQLIRLQLEAAKATRQMELEAQERMATKAAETQALQAQLDAHAREVEADAALQAASYGSDRATFSAPDSQQQSRFVRIAMGLVDAVRGLMRPGITAYTLFMLTAVFWWVRDLYRQMGLQMTQAQVHDLAIQCVGTIFYLAVTTVVWWFGVRPSQPPKARG